jgi:murein L,D-transpeptidase YcbB/YkuD
MVAACFAPAAFAQESAGRGPKPICGATALCDGGAPVAAPSQPRPARRLYVDLANAMLYAVEGGSLAFSSRVIVGAPDTPTPETASMLEFVRFRPTWRPTPRMVQTGLYEDGIRPAGPKNPLGLAAVRFVDGGLVYLHGTNNPKLFGRERRNLSNGCVRVEALDALVAWSLGWSADDTQAAMHGRRTFDATALPIPLVMTARQDVPEMAALAQQALAGAA